jgi:hypothetical protein
MKKILFSIVLSSFAISTNVFADWGTNRYFQCAITKKYTARAKLKPPGASTYSWTNDSGCTYAETDNSSLAVNGVANCAYSWARCDGNNSNQRSGWAQCGWNWGENVDLVNPIYSFSPMLSIDEAKFENEENLTAAELNDNGIEFDEFSRAISISNLNGFLRVNSKDLKNNFSTFQILVYTFKIINGETVKDQLLWKAKATILNGELLLEGNFSQNEFSNKSNFNDAYFAINNVSKKIYVPTDINIENVTVEVSGDGGNLGIGISDNYAPDLNSTEAQAIVNEIQKSNDFNFNVYVENDILNAQILIGHNNINISEIQIISLSGQKFSSNFSFDGEKYSTDISKLNSGAYLILFKKDNKFYSKKFIK